MNNSDTTEPLLIDLTQQQHSAANEERSPLLSSNSLGWKNLNFNYFRYGNCETPVHCLKHHTIGLILDRGKVERKLDGVYRLETAVRGSATIVPAGIEHWSAWNVVGRFAMLSITTEAIAKLDPDRVNSDSLELIPTFAKSKPDPLIYGIGMAIKNHLASNATDEGLYIESLTNALSAHLLQYYCSRRVSFKEYSGGLATEKLKQAVEYVNDNLDRTIRLEELARELDISQYYFSHLFRNSMGVSPYHYIIQQRIAKTARLLVTTKMPIADIALACGFSSQSQMTRHFRKLIGTTPKKYRDARANFRQ